MFAQSYKVKRTFLKYRCLFSVDYCPVLNLFETITLAALYVIIKMIFDYFLKIRGVRSVKQVMFINKLQLMKYE